MNIGNVNIGFCGPRLMRTTHLVHKKVIWEEDRTSMLSKWHGAQEVYVCNTMCPWDQDNFEERDHYGAVNRALNINTHQEIYFFIDPPVSV